MMVEMMDSDDTGPQRSYTCATCARSVAYVGAPPPNFPFCSPRCRMVDLGRWLRGQIGVPYEPPAGDRDDPTPDEP